MADLGGAVLAGSPADFGKLIAEETEKWAKVIKFANIARSNPTRGYSITVDTRIRSCACPLWVRNDKIQSDHNGSAFGCIATKGA